MYELDGMLCSGNIPLEITELIKDHVPNPLNNCEEIA
jgi:hypothetical protein